MEAKCSIAACVPPLASRMSLTCFGVTPHSTVIAAPVPSTVPCTVLASPDISILLALYVVAAIEGIADLAPPV
jgi:hypothetical protein